MVGPISQVRSGHFASYNTMKTSQITLRNPHDGLFEHDPLHASSDRASLLYSQFSNTVYPDGMPRTSYRGSARTTLSA